MYHTYQPAVTSSESHILHKQEYQKDQKLEQEDKLMAYASLEQGSEPEGNGEGMDMLGCEDNYKVTKDMLERVKTCVSQL